MDQPHSEGCFAALWPRSPRHSRTKQLAPRHKTLDGRVIAQLWDYLFRGDEVYEALEEGLRERFPGVRFIHWSEIGNIHGSDERQMIAALPGRLKAAGVDAVITSMAA